MIYANATTQIDPTSPSAKKQLTTCRNKEVAKDNQTIHGKEYWWVQRVDTDWKNNLEIIVKEQPSKFVSSTLCIQV